MADGGPFDWPSGGESGGDAEVFRRAMPRADSWDFEQFLRQGIARAQEVSGDVWTDYNEHDPGVTILEQFCFALTDLAYRTRHRMRDLLASVPDAGAGRVENAPSEQPEWFHSTGSLLSTSPITLADLRRAVLGRFPEVRNIWIRPVKAQGDREPMSFQVMVQKSRDQADAGRALPDWQLREAVWQLLQTEACLGMVFRKPDILEERSLALSATIYADPAAGDDPAALVSRMLFAVDQAISPQPRMIGYADLLNAENAPSAAAVYDGPLTQNGFVDLSGTQSWPKPPDSDEIRAALLHTPGVVSVSAVKTGATETGTGIAAAGTAAFAQAPSAYSVPVTLDGLSGVSIEQGNHRLLGQNGAAMAAAPAFLAEVERRVTHRRRQYRFAGPRLGGAKRKAEQPGAPKGERRQGLAVYRSVQHLFPAIYGLGIYGDPTVNISGHSLSNEERLEAQSQLRAYLLLMEQFLANYIAQLANAPRLLSWNEEWTQSYFVQPVPALIETPIGTLEQEPPGSVEVLVPASDGSAPLPDRLESFTRSLEAASHAFDPLDDRAERAYDHLLARVNEQFANGPLESLSHHRSADNAGSRADRNARKRQFLQRYDILATRRAAAAGEPAGAGEDSAAPSGDAKPCFARFRTRPALAERIELLAGLTAGSVRLVDHAQLGPDPTDGGVGELMIWPPAEALQRYTPVFQIGPAAFSVPLSPDGSPPPVLLLVRPAIRGRFLEIVAAGEVLVEVDPGRRGGRFGIAVWEEQADGSLQLLARSLSIAGSLAEAELMARETARALGCVADPQQDWRQPRGFNAFPARFYDRRLTMILPESEGPVPGVRDFVESLFRKEAPAHLTLDVLWVDGADLALADAGLREIYRWQNAGQAAVLRRLIERSFTTRMFPDDGGGRAS